MLAPVSLKHFCFPLAFYFWEKDKSSTSAAQTSLYFSSSFALLPFSFALSSISFMLYLFLPPPLPDTWRLPPLPTNYTVTDKPILAPTHKMENTLTSCTHTYQNTQKHTKCAREYTDISHTPYTHMQTYSLLAGLVIYVCA